jgi:hypothetical protein
VSGACRIRVRGMPQAAETNRTGRCCCRGQLRNNSERPWRRCVSRSLGQKRKSRPCGGMSALPQRADITGLSRHVRKVPTTDSCTAADMMLIRSPRRRELLHVHIGRPIIVRLIPAVPMRRIDLRRDARPEWLMTKRARLLPADTTVNIIARNL